MTISTLRNFDCGAFCDPHDIAEIFSKCKIETDLESIKDYTKRQVYEEFHSFKYYELMKLFGKCLIDHYEKEPVVEKVTEISTAIFNYYCTAFVASNVSINVLA